MMNLIKIIHQKLLPPPLNLGYIPYLSLAYLSIFFANIYFNPVSGWQLVALIGGVSIFLICYFRAFWCHGALLGFYIGAILVIGIAMSQLNWGASVFFVYSAVMCSGFKRQKTSLLGLFAVIALISAYSILTQQSGYFWIPAIVFSAIIGLIVIDQAETDRNNQALKLSQQQIQALAQTAERERISRDLHDILGHSLSVITLKSELASKMIDKNLPLAQIRAEIKAVEQLSRETLAQVRGAVAGYNQATIVTEVLKAQVATDAAGIELIVNIAPIDLPPPIESQLALVIREAITNVVRHADTDQAWITLNEDQHQLRLTIRDQGKIGVYQANAGLNNMKERIEKIGGTMHLTTLPTTMLQFVLPCIPLTNPSSL